MCNGIKSNFVTILTYADSLPNSNSVIEEIFQWCGYPCSQMLHEEREIGMSIYYWQRIVS